MHRREIISIVLITMLKLSHGQSERQGQSE